MPYVLLTCTQKNLVYHGTIEVEGGKDPERTRSSSRLPADYILVNLCFTGEKNRKRWVFFLSFFFKVLDRTRCTVTVFESVSCHNETIEHREFVFHRFMLMEHWFKNLIIRISVVLAVLLFLTDSTARNKENTYITYFVDIFGILCIYVGMPK